MPEHDWPGTDGMIISRGSLFATTDSPEAHFPMIASLRGPRFQAAIPKQTRFHTLPDHERKWANRAVDLTTGKRAVSIGSLFDVRPLRHRACWKQSRPSAFTVHPCIPHTPPPVAGHRGRSQRNMGLPAYGTRYSRGTIHATEHCARSERIQTPLHCHLNTMSQGTIV